MSYKKQIRQKDVINSVLSVRPSYNLASGTTGWHGGPDGSASISVFGGARTSKNIFKTARYSPGTEYPFLSPTKDYPVTASIHLVRVKNLDLSSSYVTSEHWYKEHWDPIMGLYDYYSQFDTRFTTQSYDFYCLNFNKDSTNIVRSVVNDYHFTLSSSFTIESWIKPFLTSSTNSDFTIVSINNQFAFGITGSNGRLFFSSSKEGIFTSSIGPNNQRWNHVAVSCNASSGSFRVNLADGGVFAHSSTLGSVNSYTGSFCIGSKWEGDLTTLGGGSRELGGSGSIRKSFHGLIHEVRVWEVQRSDSQLSSSHNKRIEPQSGLSAYYKLNDGPKKWSLVTGVVGSASLDYITSGSSAVDRTGELVNFNTRQGPIWQVNDNQYFYSDKTFSILDESINELVVVHIPSAFYGRQIATGSFVLTDNSYSSSSYGVIRTIVDDGRGGLYISGSICSSSISGKESYEGVKWNKVGCIFYGEGLAVIHEPSLLDIGQGTVSHLETDKVQLNFDGVTKIPTRTTFCRLDRLEANCSNNPTFYTEVSGTRERIDTSGSIYITTIGLYSEEGKLLAVAKSAQPIKKRPKDRLVFKIKQDF